MGNICIELTDLHFHANHGYHAEEKKTGNEFVVNLYVHFNTEHSIIVHIEQTINYAGLYEMVTKHMEIPVDLLETLAMQIAEDIKTTYPVVTKTDITITKLHAPLVRFTGKVGVHYKKEY